MMSGPLDQTRVSERVSGTTLDDGDGGAHADGAGDGGEGPTTVVVRRLCPRMVGRTLVVGGAHNGLFTEHVLARST